MIHPHCFAETTLHGAFAFVVQRFQCPIRGETTYLELTEQLCEGAMSARLAEFSAYYSNRMSYDEVAGLLERVTGQPVLSDQTIQHLVSWLRAYKRSVIADTGK